MMCFDRHNHSWSSPVFLALPLELRISQLFAFAHQHNAYSHQHSLLTTLIAFAHQHEKYGGFKGSSRTGDGRRDGRRDGAQVPRGDGTGDETGDGRRDGAQVQFKKQLALGALILRSAPVCWKKMIFSHGLSKLFTLPRIKFSFPNSLAPLNFRCPNHWLISLKTLVTRKLSSLPGRGHRHCYVQVWAPVLPPVHPRLCESDAQVRSLWCLWVGCVLPH